VDGIIYYGGRIYLVPESTLRERIMRAMRDTHLARMSMRHRRWQSYFLGRCLDSMVYFSTLTVIRIAYLSV
jgi:hypothetical protein